MTDKRTTASGNSLLMHVIWLLLLQPKLIYIFILRGPSRSERSVCGTQTCDAAVCQNAFTTC